MNMQGVEDVYNFVNDDLTHFGIILRSSTKTDWAGAWIKTIKPEIGESYFLQQHNENN